ERVIDLWAGAAAVLALLGVESAFPVEARAAAHAGTALMFASAFAWRGWRVLRYASLAAAAIAIAHALSPPLTGAALAGQIPIWGALVVLLVAALFLFGAGYFLSAGSIAFGEVLSIAGASTILIGAALLLRRFGAHPSMAYAVVVIGAAIFARWRAPGVYMTIVAPLVRGPVAWLARTYRLGPKPTDLVNVTPAARREKRYGRRQRSQ
ncbi:MAG TPA: hypothetical protein VEF55_07485, partial [Candidatus Binatia bacterium]|nr:hypothetical protein [Candidatus Binatia bacterium]